MEEKIYGMMEKLYVEFSKRFDEIDERFNDIEEKLDKKVDKTDIVRLENEVTPKLEALFDGHKQNSDKLDRIEKEVARHEEIILRRVR